MPPHDLYIKTDYPHKPKDGSNDDIFSGKKQKKKKKLADYEKGQDKEVYEDKMSKDEMKKKEQIVKGMKKNKNGSIVNLSSVSWVLGEGDKVIYETAKSAVIGLTRSFAQEYGKYNIRTNSVVPGSIATERQIKHWLTPKYKKFILEKQALKRQLKPEDVAKLVLFLSSDQSSGCTKQSFVVDGGIT